MLPANQFCFLASELNSTTFECFSCLVVPTRNRLSRSQRDLYTESLRRHGDLRLVSLVDHIGGATLDIDDLASNIYDRR